MYVCNFWSLSVSVPEMYAYDVYKCVCDVGWGLVKFSLFTLGGMLVWSSCRSYLVNHIVEINGYNIPVMSKIHFLKACVLVLCTLQAFNQSSVMFPEPQI